ncbi:MAG: energy-coupling factor transporter transmembrane component T [Candidatus Limnocylindrales bacterium]
MNARALIAWSMAGLIVALSTTNPLYRAIVALVALNVLLRWRRPEQDLRFLVRAIIFTTVGAVVLNLAVAHVGATALFSLPADWPVVGGPWTLESAGYGLDTALGLAAAVLAVAPLSYVIEPHEFVDALPQPVERAGIVVAAALNLVPGIGRSFRQVRDAQTMRGWRPSGLRSWSEVIVPVALTAVEGSLELAEAMEARAFGSGARTRYAPSHWTRWDVGIGLASGAAIAIAIGARAAGLAPDWYPYPSLSLPPADPAMLVAALLPAIAIRRGTANE